MIGHHVFCVLKYPIKFTLKLLLTHCIEVVVVECRSSSRKWNQQITASNIIGQNMLKKFLYLKQNIYINSWKFYKINH